MANVNPEIYYNDPITNSYVYESLEQMVLNFEQNYCGDGTQLGLVGRDKIVFWFKKGLQQFNYGALQETKEVELELGDTLDIILPPDFVSYVKISWVHPQTGQLMPMSQNNSISMGTAYLQDQDANVLFDQDGEILEGTTLSETLTINPNQSSVEILPCGTSACSGCSYYHNGCLNTAMYGIDITQNRNGNFKIDTRQGRIHFNSDSASRVLKLEYISDGLEYSSQSDIKINKMAEMALYAWVNYNLLSVSDRVQEYVINRARRKYEADYANASIKLQNIRPEETMYLLNARRKWLK